MSEWANLSRVTAQMALQKPRTREKFATDGTLVTRLVGEEMHGQGGHGHVDTVAEGTLMRTVGSWEEAGQGK